MHGLKKSDPAVVAMKPTNNAGGRSAAEPVEPRAGAEGNANQQSTHRTQIRARVSQALERVRQAARHRRKERFTALLHHVNVDLLWLSFYTLKRDAAPGVDGVTWTYRTYCHRATSRYSTVGHPLTFISCRHLLVRGTAEKRGRLVG
jgi:hypothetical protein